MSSRRIRLVVFDMGGTLWEEVPDERAVFRPNRNGRAKDDVFYQIDSRHMYRYDGVSNRIFPGVRQLMDELYRREMCVSVNSLNTPHAWRWIESEFFDLNRDDFVRHSRIGEHPNPKLRVDSHKTDIKGTWMQQIIDEWNANECREQPVTFPEVLFVDDNEWNHRAVERICPGVHCLFPPVTGANGMLDLLQIIEHIDNGGHS
jgi:FMN phosphatase YigB (HAD superfamily)